MGTKHSDINDIIFRDGLPSMFKEKENVFLNYLIECILEINASTEVNFAKFLNIISCFSCYNEEDIMKFTFATFDLNNSGTLASFELKLFLNSIKEHESDFPNEIKRALSYFNNDFSLGSGISFLDFQKLNEQFPHILWPAFRLQYRMQEHTLGHTKWVKYQSKLRYPNKYRSYKFLMCFCFPQNMNKEDNN